MVDFEKQFDNSGYAATTRVESAVSSVFARVYGWMAVGLALSGVIAWCTYASGLYERVLTGGGMLFCVVAEFVLVIALSAAIDRIPPALAALMFLVYSALNGLTLSVVFVAYELGSVQSVFFITSGMFAGLALWGSFTKGDLTGIGSFCGMALWGLVIGGVVNMFMRSSGFDWFLSFAGILVFTGLTMYDAQKIRRLAAREATFDAVAVRKLAIIGALELYLDFVNLFLHILRFLGKKK